MDVNPPQRPRVLALYRASAAVTPSADTDALIFAAARAAHAPPRKRREAFIALAAAASVAAVFIIRIATTPAPDTASSLTRDFGIDEGRTGAYLMTMDLQTPTGPGSQEGLP